MEKLKKQLDKNLKAQKKAHSILEKNAHFVWKGVPFNPTSNYVGMLIETNLHRAMWEMKPLK